MRIEQHRAGEYTIVTEQHEWRVHRQRTGGGRALWRAQREEDGWIYLFATETLDDIKQMLAAGNAGHRWRRAA